ncbi:MAG: ribosome biogenesis GTPase YlqF [Erysipelotrichaceae bacterium]|nr:ribosome biogenesis GTPase YlqF [Erysipelotrichaceae bacterium]
MSETKTNINWFPGHMAKARREMSENIKYVDMVIEIRDGRIVASSENPLLREIAGNKPRLIVISKKDKAEDEVTARWIEYFRAQGKEAIALNLIADKSISKKISDACLKIMADKVNKYKAKGMKHVEIKAMVVGIPNVGKSTLINAVAQKKAAKTADRPGVTRSLKWIKISSDVALLDTPGVLWPKFEDEKTALNLAITGAINDDILPVEDVVRYAVGELIVNHPEKLEQRYGIEVSGYAVEVIDRIGEARGCLSADGVYDYKRIYALILKDIRDSQLGGISWEKPEDADSQ